MNKIIQVISGGIGEEIGIEKGDRLISINGVEIKDVIDYRFQISDEALSIEIEKEDGEIWIFDIDKEFDEDLGLVFNSGIMDKATSCSNNCIFCFVDQLPKGLRKSLYFKDDDSRLSFLQGNFITLTNTKEEDIDRIIRYKISPINVSVHTTNPALRIKMLGNKNAGNILDLLKKLTEGGIKINCQIVLCPGINNGEELLKTVKDLLYFYPSIENVAIVPIGITKYRQNLFKVKGYDKNLAKKEIESLIDIQNKNIKNIGSPFLRLSDEFYLLAEMEIPNKSFYGDFEQVEDGVGITRILRENITNNLTLLKKKVYGSFTFITGTLAKKEIEGIADLIMNQNENIQIDVVSIINNFFGETITVAGLLTGEDILTQLSKINIGKYVIIPKNMVRYDDTVFLDDMTLDALSKSLDRKIVLCDYTGKDLISIINNYCWEEK